MIPQSKRCILIYNILKNTHVRINGKVTSIILLKIKLAIEYHYVGACIDGAIKIYHMLTGEIVSVITSDIGFTMIENFENNKFITIDNDSKLKVYKY